MAADTGRALKIYRSSTLIAAVVSKTVTINNEPIDITTDDDLGFRTLLEESATKSVDIGVEGVLEEDTLLAVAANPATAAFITADKVEFPSGALVEGNFRLNSLETSGSVDGRVDFSATLQSSGAWTWTP